MDPCVQLRAHFVPRNRLYFTRVELTDATLDLFGPRRLDVILRFTVKRFQQAPGELRTVGLGQLSRLFEQFQYVSGHDIDCTADTSPHGSITNARSAARGCGSVSDRVRMRTPE